MNETNGMLVLSLGTMVVGVIGMIIRYSFKSKCSEVHCCFGLISFKREPQFENDIEMKQEGAPSP
jgi:hypothetical protein